MKVVGTHLKAARLKRGLSLRKFAEVVGEDFTVLARIEKGERFPPRKKLKAFAKALSLSPRQLEALIAVERRGLNPLVLLPEISPAQISNEWIEMEADKVLKRFANSQELSEMPLRVPIEEVIQVGCGLSTHRCDFDKDREIASKRGRALYGGLYTEGFHGKARVVVVNTGRIRGKQMNEVEERATIAHEAGHYALHCGNKDSAQLFLRFTTGPTFCREAECDQDSFDPLEYQASAFGACLLMPKKQFLAEWKRQTGSITKLSGAFDVSEAFVRLRTGMLGL